MAGSGMIPRTPAAARSDGWCGAHPRRVGRSSRREAASHHDAPRMPTGAHGTHEYPASESAQPQAAGWLGAHYGRAAAIQSTRNSTTVLSRNGW